MARFTGKHSESFIVDVPLARAKAHFSSLDAITASFVGLERAEQLDEQTLRFTLVPKSALGVTFAGQYRCRYDLKDDLLSWRTVGQEANVFSSGQASFVALDDTRTRIEYSEIIECEIAINRLLGKAIAPVVQRDIAQGVKTYLERMRASLPSTPSQAPS